MERINAVQKLVGGPDSGAPATGLRVTLRPIQGRTPSRVFGDLDEVVFPAVMNNLEISEQATFTDFDSVGAGSFSVRRAGDESARELRSFSLEVYATDIPELPFLQSDAPDTWSTVRDQIRKVFRARFPVYLEAVVIKTAFAAGVTTRYSFQETEEIQDFQGAVTLRSFSQRLEPGQPESRYFSMEVKDWRDMEDEEEVFHYGRVHLPLTHTVRAGETLWILAERFYHRGSSYKHIAGQNQRLRGLPGSADLLSQNPPVRSVRIPRPPPASAR